MKGLAPEGLLSRLMQQAGTLSRPGYLILRGEPTLIVLVFERGAARPRYVFKAAREAASVATLEREYGALEALARRATGDFAATLPRPLGRAEDAGLFGYLHGVLPGQRMKDLPGRALFGDAGVGDTLRRVAGWLGELFETAGMDTRGETSVGREQLFDAPARKYLSWFRVTEGERELLRSSLAALPAPGTVRLPLCRGHGDFSPANVLWDDGRLGVVDFEFALEPSSPLDDLFYFLAAMRTSKSARERVASRSRFSEEIFYGTGRLSRAARDAVRQLSSRVGLDLELIEPLFVLAWVRYAVRSVELQIENLGLGPLAEDPEKLWQRLDAEPEEFLPVVRIRAGVCGNIRQHLERRERFVLTSE